MIEDNIQKKTLSIRVSTNGFCFCSYTPSLPDSLQFFFYCPVQEISLAANLRQAIEECPFDVKGCNIKAIVETGEFTQIPAEFDDRQDYREYWQLCFPGAGNNMEIVANKMTAHNFTILFPVEKATYEVLQQYGTVSFYTPISILAGYLTRTPLPEEQYMLCYSINGHAILMSIKGGQIRISNLFKFNNEQNLLFYLLSTWKEQELSQTGDTLYICGDCSIEKLQPECGRFIKNIKRINPNTLFSPSILNKLKEIPFDLQALILCE